MFLLIDKPKGITSHDVVDKVREITGERRVGHAGTLDPNATGLLIIGVGRDSTKHLGKIAKDTKKTYEAEIYLGEERDTDDSEGNILRPVRRKLRVALSGVERRQALRPRAQGRVAQAKGVLPPADIEVRLILATFFGSQEQIPPTFSAIKIKGKKAYELAREKKKVDLKPRGITVHLIKLVSYKYPVLKIKTIVSSGTYIRALARDIGKRLGMGAYLKNLRRTKIGEFDLKEAVKLKDLKRSDWKKFVKDIQMSS